VGEGVGEGVGVAVGAALADADGLVPEPPPATGRTLAATISVTLPAGRGSLPVRPRKAMTPRACTSLAGLPGSPASCSGAR
jgi:hypothetical protein